MTVQTYQLSCHCGAVRCEADVDLAEGSGRCNCSICAKLRKWGAVIRPSAFRLLAGEDALSNYQFGGFVAHHQFCKHCGVHVFGKGYVEEIGGDYYSVNLACIDNIEHAELAEVPVTYFDGRHNNWFEVPTVTRHL
ncbi:GFA family protein [Lysobacter sp. CA196]|uniref:GFA family protein n=1 Tax=Lysobacter sp. CA196 TaxID=3455606 RepID=UPI003F8D7C4A